VGSFPDPAVSLDPSLPELAFVGRSNVGKSSLINALLGRRRLARVSGTPGKTTLINVYRLPGFYLVDLPGYGWARASKKERASYRSLVRGYLQNRTTLHGVVWLLDIRHPPSADDREMQSLLAEAGLAALAVITKADKLAVGALQERVRALTEALELDEDQVLLVSSKTGLGIADLGASLLAAADGWE
jgi:GTP-binding protein